MFVASFTTDILDRNPWLFVYFYFIEIICGKKAAIKQGKKGKCFFFYWNELTYTSFAPVNS